MLIKESLNERFVMENKAATSLTHDPDLYRRLDDQSDSSRSRHFQNSRGRVAKSAGAGCGIKHMTTPPSLVSVVDDDESIRESLPDLLREFGFAVRAFSSAEEFLASDCIDQTRCLILDIAMPGMTGPELQQELKNRRQAIPIIFITAQRDETIRSLVLGQGATECLYKPFSEAALSDALNAALEKIETSSSERLYEFSEHREFRIEFD